MFLPQRDAAPEGPIPAQFTKANPQPVGENRWWHEFDSEELNHLIDEALEENLDLRQVWARLNQAGSIAVQAKSSLYPQLDLLGDTSYRRSVTTVETEAPSLLQQTRDSVITGTAQGIGRGIDNALSGTATPGVGTGISAAGVFSQIGQNLISESAPTRLRTETRNFGLSLAASWEIDIWGRITSAYRAAQLDLESTEGDLQALALTLAAEVAGRWLRIVEQQALIELLNEQLETNDTYLELVELRFRKGQVSALDVFQQRQIVAEVREQIPLVEAQEQVLRHDLAVLLGQSPTAELEVGNYDLSTVPEFPPTGVPADLLMNRPDVRASLARLHAADYRVASARADRLPAIRLTGGIGYNADDIANFFDDWFLNLAGGLTAPLFDGFRREAEVNRTLAVVEELLADYRLTVLIAIREVEDALVLERKQREHIDALVQELDAAQSALREAGQRYRKGLNDYLPVLDALERTQFLTRSLISARRELLIYRIDLYRALGGSWAHELSPPARLSERPANESSVHQEPES